MSIEWLSSSPFLRRAFMKAMRAHMRLQRATAAEAILVLSRGDGCYLAVVSDCGARLPRRQLDAWRDIQSQVDGWLYELFAQATSGQLAAVDGVPGPAGVTFVYTAQLENDEVMEGAAIWIERDTEIRLDAVDRRLLQLAERRLRARGDDASGET